MLTTLIVILALYALVMTVIAIRQTAYLDSANLAIAEYKRMIAETREGKPPFLLNRGVNIVKDDQ